MVTNGLPAEFNEHFVPGDFCIVRNCRDILKDYLGKFTLPPVCSAVLFMLGVCARPKIYVGLRTSASSFLYVASVRASAYLLAQKELKNQKQ